MGFEKYIKTVLGICFGAACTQLANLLKNKNVHLLQLTFQADVLAAEMQSREKWKNPVEIYGNPDSTH